MKSDHRHELKTNELADWLTHFPEWAQENRTTLIGVGVAIVLVIAVYAVQYYRRDVVGVRQHVQLTNLVTQVPMQKRVIAQEASQGTDRSIELLPIAQDLQAFAASSGNDRMAALALIKQAEALRAELHYRLTEPGKDDVAKQIAQAQSSYQEALKRAGTNVTLAALAEFGLGLCEEELGNFDKAKATYQAVAENPDYEGTTAQAAAAHRLKTVDDYKGTIAFRPAPQPKPESAASMPTIQLGPGAENSPITIQAVEEVPPADDSAAAEPTADEAPAAPVTEANTPTGN